MINIWRELYRIWWEFVNYLIYICVLIDIFKKGFRNWIMFELIKSEKEELFVCVELGWLLCFLFIEYDVWYEIYLY